VRTLQELTSVTFGMTIMVMNAIPHRQPPIRLSAAKRVGVAEAKAHFSEVLRNAQSRPTVIHSRGRSVAVLLSVADYDALVSGVAKRMAGKVLMESLADWRADYGGVAFKPERVPIAPRRFPSRAR
jgi:prevent-host-death family protein